MSFESNKNRQEADLPQRKLQTFAERVGIKLHVFRRSLSLFLGKVPPTARGGETYCSDLFPEMKSADDVLTSFRGKCVVDVGCGDTYLQPDSLINKVASQADPETLYIGIDPNVGHLEWLVSGADIQTPIIPEFDATKDYAPGPGKEFTVRGSLPETSLPEKGVDLFLSNFAIGFWVVREKKLMAVLQAMEEALTDNGEIRLNPVRKELFEQDNELGTFIKERFSMEFHGNDEGLLIFRRKR